MADGPLDDKMVGAGLVLRTARKCAVQGTFHAPSEITAHPLPTVIERYSSPMPHVIEAASSGRAKCRGCEQRIAKGELRLGERRPNVFGDGEMTIWLHLRCAAYKRPEPLLEAMRDTEVDLDDAKLLATAAEHSIAFRRLPRINGAQRAPTGRARCRSCKELIEKESWRIPLAFFEDGRFQPSGFIHAPCAPDYFETLDFIDQVRHFSPDLDDDELAEFGAALNSSS